MRNEIWVSPAYGLANRKSELEAVLNAMPAEIVASDGSMPKGVVVLRFTSRQYLLLLDAAEFTVKVNDPDRCRYTIQDLPLGRNLLEYRAQSPQSNLQLRHQFYINSKSTLFWSEEALS